MNRLRVLVVDDSAFSRRTITRMLEGLDVVEVVGYAVDGEDGIHKTIALKPDLVTLDLEMPRLDGFSLLRVLHERFSTPVIVVSASSSAEKVFRALELGAFDFVAKPSSTASHELLEIRADLHAKVLQVAHLKLRKSALPSKSAGEPRETQVSKPEPPKRDSDVRHPFDIVAIGASTGGPPALHAIAAAFQQEIPFAIVISQHMPPGFTHAFAERLGRFSAFKVKEAEDGDPVLPGHMFVAPGGYNLLLEHSSGQVVTRVVVPSKTDRYVPSVDAMLESCARVFRDRVLAVILTGMGNDGSSGVQAVKSQGGYVIAESEETAVVYGMPREACATGAVDCVLPLNMIPSAILRQGGFDMKTVHLPE
ncbi:MAG TPA: chemotaxis response regulator protein-glutamate methylesterase [Deltaproteobacteria bacterium]|nr:chemotaxis response regulator protein-glutamate methylesterase [Deltaproteobacteria bacterium]HQB37828.1 chemotaxis response regulator protein-glutamate methylesterase [Deltaproteobacteria bacterium]